MPTARSSRKIAAPAPDLWRVLSDPHHLPRWWPRVTRVEDVREDAFTEVMKTRKGKTVRADFEIVHADPATGTLRWDQRIEGTPFAGVLSVSETVVTLRPLGAVGAEDASAEGTEVTIEMRQEISARPTAGTALGGSPLFPAMGRRMLSRAAKRLIDEALDGLERIHG
jgi:uncharacterized protein YndB with AHSA1/START domain